MQYKLFKPCPFCGANEENIVIKHNPSKHGRFYYLECEVCGARTRGLCRTYNMIPDHDQETYEDEWKNEQVKTAIKLWNRRSGVNAEQDS